MPQISGSKNLISVLSNTLLIAKECNSDMGTEHLLCGLLSVPSAKSAAIFDKAGLSLKKVQQFLTKSQAPLAAPPMYTTNVNTILKNAERFSKEQGYGAVRTEFVLYALLLQGDCVAARILQSTVGIKKLKSITEDFILSQNQSQQDVSSISQRTHLHSQRRGDFGQLQGQAGQDSQKRQDLSHLSLSGQSVTDGQADCQSLPSQLLKLGTDMTRAMATKPTDPLIGRDEEIERIVQILCRKSKNNPVLVGEPGVGKTAVVEGLAKRIASGQVPPFLLDKTIFSLDIASLMAGTRYRGDLEERLKEAIDLITNSKNIIIFIDEIHTILKADGQKGDIGPADILKPFLARGQLQTIGATTIDEYRKYIEKDKAFERRFLPVYIDPPSVAQTIKIISGLRQNLEKFHNVTLTDEAIEAAAKLSDRYITDRFLPDKAIDLIDEAMSMAKVGCANSCADQSKSDEALVKLKAQKLDFLSRELYAQASKIDDQIKQLEQAEQQQRANNDKNQQTILSQKMAQIGFDDIAKVVSKWTKIPVGKIGDQQSITLLGLSSALKTRVIGQDGAIDGVCDAIKRSKTGLADPNRPIGTFLFVGPSGVGKTELSKAVAAEVMGDESSLIRLDMSEYLESHSVSKLIGAPPGYVGHDDGGQLTEQVRRRPYSVVLFDEIEKAHHDIYNILLQILDEGHLTDSLGRTVNFKNTIIILTSNVGIDQLNLAKKLSAEFSAHDILNQNENTEQILSQALKQHFRPEFLNRIDKITFFHPLSPKDTSKIVDILLKKLFVRLSEKGITLFVCDQMKNFIIDQTQTAEYGARPLKRTIAKFLETPLSDSLLQGKIKDGDSLIIDYVGGKVVINKG